MGSNPTRVEVQGLWVGSSWILQRKCCSRMPSKVCLFSYVGEVRLRWLTGKSFSRTPATLTEWFNSKSRNASFRERSYNTKWEITLVHSAPTIHWLSLACPFPRFFFWVYSDNFRNSTPRARTISTATPEMADRDLTLKLSTNKYELGSPPRPQSESNEI